MTTTPYTKYRELHRAELVQYKPNIRDPKDSRKKISKAVFSYFDDKFGYEWRKSFTDTPNTPIEHFEAIAPLVLIHAF
jgi:hypothetical protein